MTVPLITIANRVPDSVKEPYYKYESFLKSCERQGFEPVFLGGKPEAGKRIPNYRGLMSKPRLLLDWIHQNGSQHDRVIVCDAFDIVLICGKDEIIYNFKGIGAPIVMNAERNCFPRVDLSPQFPQASTPFRFLNSGFFVGETLAVVSMLETMRDKYGFPDDYRNLDGSFTAHNDQEDYSLYFLDHQDIVRLDTTAILCQSLHDAGPREFAFDPDRKRVISMLTHNEPCVVHGNGNGKAWLERIIRWLGL